MATNRALPLFVTLIPSKGTPYDEPEAVHIGCCDPFQRFIIRSNGCSWNVPPKPPQLEGLGGVYCEDCDIAVPVSSDSNELRGVRPRAIDQDYARELWNVSEKLTGISFPSAHDTTGDPAA